jgi:predicted  nucleic acid-binding Zn-ribbon protein
MFGLGEPEPPRATTPGAGPAPQQSGAPQSGPGQQPPAAQPAPAQGQAPQYIYVQAPPPAWTPPAAPSGGSSLKKWVIVLAVLIAANLALAISNRFQFGKSLQKHTDQLTLLSRRMDANDDRYAQLKGQFEVTSQRLGLTQAELGRARQLAANIQKQQHEAVQQLNMAIQKKASAQDLNKLQSEANTKFGSLSGDIAGTQKDLQATKEALTGAKGELSGAIARTHDELVALAHRTDRDYFEFKLPRKRARQKIGSVMIELLKTDQKKNLYTLNLYFDDKRTERKDNALDQPVFFYVQGASSALELVVNKLGKNTISGYVSTPKGFFASTPTVLSQRPT